MKDQTPDGTYTCAIDSFAAFGDRIWLRGWVFANKPVGSLELRMNGIPGGVHRIRSYGQTARPDLAEQYGPAAASFGFDEWVDARITSEGLTEATIAIRYADGAQSLIVGIGAPRQVQPLIEKFRGLISQQATGALLEVGSRARSGIVRKDFTPNGWAYTGFDIVAGPNVDVVGDAHELASLFQPSQFDAVMAFSVLEHLLMPWKFVIELNHVMRTGAVGLFTTHQCWPAHDQPWDFWRLSDEAWKALLNAKTGFEIIEAKMDEPAFVVAQRCNPITNFGTDQVGWLASSVLFRKASDTSLAWPVRLDEALTTSYPSAGCQPI